MADTAAAERFYREVVGLNFAYRDPGREIVFLWADTRENGMIGLWGPGTTCGPGSNVALSHHLAFAIEFDRLQEKIEALAAREIETFGFGGEKTREPSVIGWMPSAQIYFRDPDGHLLEFISFFLKSQSLGLSGVIPNGFEEFSISNFDFRFRRRCAYR